MFISSESDPRLVRVATFGRGACFGEMALLTGEPRSATVLADGPGKLLRLDHDRFQELVRKACIGFIAATLLGLVAVFPYWRWLKPDRVTTP